MDKSLKEKDRLKREGNATKRNIPKLNDLSIAINKRLIELEKNQEWLAHTTEIGKATISAYYNAESMPNSVNLISLSEALETTPDYLLGYSDSASRDIDIKSIHEKIGLSDKAIENMELHCYSHNGVEGGFNGISEALNMLLEQDDFMKLLNSIRFHLLEAENKEYYLMEQRKLDKDSLIMNILETINLGKLDKDGSWWLNSNMFDIESLMKGEPLTLDPLEYFMYSNNQIKEKFISIVNNIIDTHISSVDVEKAVIDRRNDWDYNQAEMKKESELLD